MATRAPKTKDAPEDPEIIHVSPEEGRRMFDEVAREWTGMSGEEFIRRWETGEYADMADDEDHRHIVELVLMIPLARQDSESRIWPQRKAAGRRKARVMANTVPLTPIETEIPTDLEDYFIDPEDGRRLFDETAREWTGMSGEEFIRRWEAGEYADMPDDEEHRHIVELVLMIPLARQNR